jgi:hypothetical protein
MTSRKASNTSTHMCIDKTPGVDKEATNKQSEPREAGANGYVAPTSTPSTADLSTLFPSSRWSLIPPPRRPLQLPLQLPPKMPTQIDVCGQTYIIQPPLPTILQSRGLKHPIANENSLRLENKVLRARNSLLLGMASGMSGEKTNLLRDLRTAEMTLEEQADMIEELQEENKSLKAQLAAAQGRGQSDEFSEDQM